MACYTSTFQKETCKIEISFAAGQEYSQSTYGGPSNMLCLPNNPELSNRTSPGYSLLVGTEYEDGNFFINGAQDEDVPCSLCRSRNTSSSIMIPGRQSCDHGWKTEYHGILASGSYTQNHQRTSALTVIPNFFKLDKITKMVVYCMLPGLSVDLWPVLLMLTTWL
ncbi:unnamed protein product [Mytilus edulis]|uniref:Uncharacterized protein n=1 Tax=Mytilus edulis TaxID=6550 RepID=A0A8S3SFL9_MYTED|nr:unnamed protein product [Mytilus edulis]